MDASNQDTLIDNLCKVKGIGKNKALALAAAWELGRRRTSFQRAIVTTPKDLLPYVQHFAMYPTEHFVTAILNGAQEILDIKLISVGGTNKAFIHPREVFAEAISRHASAIICCHNHPGGTCAPSPEDISSTIQLQRLLNGVGILVLDHIIVAGNRTYSMIQHGDIDYRIKGR
jgi:DNA repair protein RadC